MYVHVLQSLFSNGKASGIAAGCCRDHQLMKHDGEYAAESPGGEGGC